MKAKNKQTENSFLTINHKTAFHYFCIAASKGYMDSLWRVAFFELNYRGDENSCKKAEAQIRKAMKRGLIDAAWMFTRIFHLPQEEKVTVLKKLAENEYPAAMWFYGLRLFHGNCVLKSEIEGRKFLEKAALSGESIYASSFEVLYENGIDGFPKSSSKAKHFHEISLNGFTSEVEYFW